MSLPLVTAVAPRWESDLAELLATAAQVHLARRCADTAELLGVVAAGIGQVALLSSDLRGLDRAVVDTLTGHGVLVLGVHPPDDDAGARLLRRWGVAVVVPADTAPDALSHALDELIDGHREGERRPRRASSASQSAAGASLPAAEVADPLEALDPGWADAPDKAATPSEPREGEDLDEVETGEAQGQPVADERDGEHGQVVVVWGPSGSPGRTTVAVNLAAELADPLTPVLLVDADTYAASAAQSLAVLDEVPGIAAAARAADQHGLDRDALSRLAPEVRPGLRVLTGLPRADRWTELRDVALADVLEECRRVARWTVVDVAACLEQDEELSFDTLAPRRNGATLTALDAADRVVVVGAGDPVGLQRLVRGLDQLSRCTQAPRTVVVTRVRPGPVGPDPGRRIQEALDRFAGTGPVHLVPEDQESLDVALLHGKALLEVRPLSPARQALAELADLVGERSPARGRRRSSRVRAWFGRRASASA